MIPLKQGERYYDEDDNEWFIVELTDKGTGGSDLQALLVRSDGSPRATEIDHIDLKPPRWRKSCRRH